MGDMNKRRSVTGLLLSATMLVGAVHSASAKDKAKGGNASIEVRVMTFNVKQHNPKSKQPKEEPTHWERRKPVAFEIVRRSAPDIVGLQEPYRSQLDDFRKAFPEFDEIGKGRRGGSRDEHSSILYRSDRFRADASGTFWLSDTPEKVGSTWGHFYPRICTWARLVWKNSGKALYVYNTHLDHKSQAAREKSVRLIAQRIRDRKHKDPFVLTGDFNAGEANPAIIYLTGRSVEASPAPVVDSFRLLHPDEKIVGTGNRFEGRADGEKIDYIFVPPGTEVLEANIIRTHKEGLYPSDHFPVTARLRFSSAPTDATKGG